MNMFGWVRRLMTSQSGDFEGYVEHPRYGRTPQITGLNPQISSNDHTFNHWHSPAGRRIPNTAIEADLNRQTPATVPHKYYFDLKRECRDCARPFIFFAAEQKYWYETLGFGLDSDCVRCTDCRKKQQHIARRRERYETLSHITERSVDDTLEMADCCLTLIENFVFGHRSIQKVRWLLNSVPAESDVRRSVKYKTLVARVVAIGTDDSAM